MNITISKETNTQEEKAQSGTRVLVVDDEQAMQLLASAIVNRVGHRSTSVGSGEEAVAECKNAIEENDPYHIVVMDLALPGGMSGLEATIALKQLSDSIKVIVSSGYLEQNARSAALEHGFAGILPKPYTADRLAAELRWVLKDRKTDEES